ncbi:hypothetical protein Tco_1127593, partial [Tanacetum coccineum]
MIHYTSLTSLNRDSLETHISLDEIKTAVWVYGSNKVPGPDGFSFAFIKKYWDIIKTDIFEFVNSFFVSDSMPQGANSSFFTLILKTSNPIYNKDFRPISLIEIHYKIIVKVLANWLSKVIDKVVSKEQSAFISGRQVLEGPRIISEVIQWASILIDGSPTFEFSIKCGLRQGDPLSPFPFYSCYGRSHRDLDNFPFTYLGLPIGSNMNLTSSWNILVKHFQKRLSSWKANLLSIGGRLTLIKAVLESLSIYYLSIFKAPDVILKSLERLRSRFFLGGSQDAKSLAWVKWSNLLPSFKKGVLNVCSLKAFNLALRQKWRWRLFSSLNVHWVKVIKALHGQEGGLDHQ